MKQGPSTLCSLMGLVGALIVKIGFFLCSMVLLSCQMASSPQLSKPSKEMLKPIEYASAFEACHQVPDSYQNELKQAYLYKIEGLWIGLSGRSSDWHCYFFQPVLHKVYVFQGEELSLIDISHQAPEPLNIRGLIDSDLLLRRLWFDQRLSFPLYSVSLEGMIWRVESTGNTLLIDGAKLSK